MDAHVVKKDEARLFGKIEICREYVKTERITLGTSTLEPGKTGGIDWGHKDATEIFFVMRGKVVMRTPKSAVNEENTYSLEEGDAIVIPQDVPHELTNVGDVTAVLSWSLAPGMNE